MKVLRIGTQPGDVHFVEMENKLEAFQEAVGGYIECCAPIDIRQAGMQMLCNEEGLLKGLDVNSNLYPFFFVGNIIVVGVDYQEEDFVGLNDYQTQLIILWLDSLLCEQG